MLTVPVRPTKSGLWTPVWTNVTMGASISRGEWTRFGRWIEFNANLLLGTGWAFSNSPQPNLPFTAEIAPSAAAIEAMLVDVSANNYEGGVFDPSTTSAGRVISFSSNGTYSNAATVQTSVPFAWTAGDIIEVIGHYLAAGSP